MTIDISAALTSLKPKAQWNLDGFDYSGLTWLDKTQTKPTEQEIELKLAELKYQEEVNAYKEKRKLEYPDWGDQLDQIYHSGIDVWKSNIKLIKDKYPKQTMDATELQKRKDAVVFNFQKKDYEKAVARLAQYELSAGVKGAVRIETVWDESIESYVNKDVFDYIIEPLPLSVDDPNTGGTMRNPLVVQDENERVAAQEVINNTPQAVIDSINT